MFACLLPVTSFQGSCRNESLVFSREATPCTAADPLAVVSALQLLLPATAVTVCSRIWCWSLLGTSSACLLKTAMLVLIHIELNTLFPSPLWHADGIMELLGKAAVVAACLHCQSLSRNGLSCAGLSDVRGCIPTIYELPLRSCSQPAGCPELSLWQGPVMVLSSASFNHKW